MQREAGLDIIDVYARTVGGSECGAGTECATFTGVSGTTSSYCE